MPAAEQVREIRAQLKDLAALNQQIGIGAIFQNHSPSGRSYVGGDLAEMYDIVKDFDPAQIGVAFDIGHALVVHGDDWRRHFEKLKSHLKIAYVKDVKREGRWVPFGEGDIGSTGYFKLLKRTGLPGASLTAHRVRLDRRREVQDARGAGQGAAGQRAGVEALARVCVSGLPGSAEENPAALPEASWRLLVPVLVRLIGLAEDVFPLTPALSPRRGRIASCLVKNQSDRVYTNADDRAPSPWGEGGGEGERDVRTAHDLRIRSDRRLWCAELDGVEPCLTPSLQPGQGLLTAVM